ncbi:MAG TPA: hypothetical protein VGE97_06355, partial [Nitrososphaera sp.]
MSNQYQEQEQKHQTKDQMQQTIDEQAQLIKKLTQDLVDIKTIIIQGGGAHNPHLLVDWAHRDLTEQNRIQQEQQDKENARRRELREQQEQDEYDKLRTEVLKENPVWEKIFNQASKDAQEVRDAMLKIAEEFYNLEEDKAGQYCTIKHIWNESAVKHLIHEHADSQNKYALFTCRRCNMTYNSIGETEQHIYQRADSHYDANIRFIKDEYIDSVSRARKELDQLIYSGIQAKHKAEQLRQAR